MRILWFSNIPLPDVDLSSTGAWLSMYADGLQATGAVELHVVTSTRPRQGWSHPIPHTFLSRGRNSERIVRDLLASYSPDVIHIHGTEGMFGALPTIIANSQRTIISIQGLLHVYAQYWVNSLGWRDALRCVTPQHSLVGVDPFGMERRFIRLGRREKAVLSTYRNFIGRTEWDRAHVLANNPAARYFECHEPMREPFYRVPRRQPIPGRIYVTSADLSYKGGHVALGALRTLLHDRPEAHLRISGTRPRRGFHGSGYLKWLNRQAILLGIEGRIEWLGPIGAEQIVAEFGQAQVHLTPSFIENSCNAFQEAMLQAVPCVVSYAGGMPSLARDREHVLFFSPGDAEVCAGKIRDVMERPLWAEEMGARARQLGLVRNDRTGITQRLLDIYRQVLEAS